MSTLSTNDTLFICTYDNLQPFLDYCDENNIPWREIAKTYDIPANLLKAGQWLPTSNALTFLGRLFASTTEPVGIEVGENITLADFPKLHRQLKNVDTLEEAVDIYIGMSLSAFSSHIHVWTEKINDQWMLCHRSAFPSTMPGFNQTEWFRTLALLALFRHFIGAEWQPETLWMCTEPHLSSIKPEKLNQATIVFGQPFGAIPLPVSADHHPMQKQLDKMDWLAKVEALITTYATLPRFSVGWFSQLVGLSSRTLQRRLKDRNVSLSQLRDKARYEKAKQLLTSTELPIIEISNLCGYTDVSNFNRAFKSWSGVTAPKYRQQAFQVTKEE